jgi:putative ABC transport system permease protein
LPGFIPLETGSKGAFWYAMHSWLQSFAYRTIIAWWVFLLATGAAVLITFLTVGFHSIKAAVADPVDSLRSE